MGVEPPSFGCSYDTQEGIFFSVLEMGQVFVLELMSPVVYYKRCDCKVYDLGKTRRGGVYTCITDFFVVILNILRCSYSIEIYIYTLLVCQSVCIQ